MNNWHLTYLSRRQNKKLNFESHLQRTSSIKEPSSLEENYHSIQNKKENSFLYQLGKVLGPSETHKRIQQEKEKQFLKYYHCMRRM